MFLEVSTGGLKISDVVLIMGSHSLLDVLVRR